MQLSADLSKLQLVPVIPARNCYVSREEFLYLLLSWLDSWCLKTESHYRSGS
jgi:hypothetical protein